MTYHYELKLRPRTESSTDDPRTVFYWPVAGSSSFNSPFGPRLGAVGDVNPLNADLVRLALLVLSADRSTPRSIGKSNWSSRQFSLTVPVSESTPWNASASEIGRLLGFLTGDHWVVAFKTSRPPKEQAQRTLDIKRPSRVVLMSGGADSALGVLASRRQLTSDESHLLVSHLSLNALGPIQREVASSAETLVPGPEQQVHQIRLGRRRHQVEGTKFRNESSTRSRSLLFLALGLAFASLDEVPLWIPENGFASLNPPLAANRRGSLSTKTTHPRFLEGLSAVLAKIGAQSEIVNPFASLTKGQMFRNAADQHGDQSIAEFLSATHSCGLTGQRSKGVSTALQCGVCFGCVVRRSSFTAAGLHDSTNYCTDNPDPPLADWLERQSVMIDVRRFAKKGVSRRDLLALGLPIDYPLADALALCDQAAEELGDFVG